jgi:hypothetical protein
MATNEQHYTVKELAKKWRLSTRTIRRWCEEHGGVLSIDRPETIYTRDCLTMRIPQSTVDVIYKRHFIPAKDQNRVQQSELVSTKRDLSGAQSAHPSVQSNPVFSCPKVTIFTRHTRDCPHRRDQYFQSCDCPELFSYRDIGRRCTVRSGTRSWVEAEEMKVAGIHLVETGEQLTFQFAIMEVRKGTLLILKEAAMYAGTSEEALQQAMERGELYFWPWGKYTYVNRSDLIAFCKRNDEDDVRKYSCISDLN